MLTPEQSQAAVEGLNARQPEFHAGLSGACCTDAGVSLTGGRSIFWSAHRCRRLDNEKMAALHREHAELHAKLWGALAQHKPGEAAEADHRATRG